MKKDKNIILDNFIWRFAERCGAQLVTAVVTLLLARILMPEDYAIYSHSLQGIRLHPQVPVFPTCFYALQGERDGQS